LAGSGPILKYGARLAEADAMADHTLVRSDSAGSIRPGPRARGSKILPTMAVIVPVATAAILAAGLVLRARSVLLLCLLAAAMVPLELAWPLHARRGLRHDAHTDVVHFIANGLLKNVTIAMALALGATGLRDAVPDAMRRVVGGQPLWQQAFEALVLSELLSYWAHRLAHTWQWWWRFHKVHHSVAELDWLAAGRVHPLDQALQRCFLIIPLYVAGFDGSVLGTALALFTVQGFFVHANLRWRFGWLRNLVVTPEFHHWHHSLDPRARNANYSGKFPVLDMLFGSYYLPDGEWPTGYGVGEAVPDGWLRQILWPFSTEPRGQ
jgi:sterol desaturase/sphingolipid hydroxylase (fatty acid hydroxylase superfamily)